MNIHGKRVLAMAKAADHLSQRFRVFAPQVALNREKGDIAFSP